MEDKMIGFVSKIDGRLKKVLKESGINEDPREIYQTFQKLTEDPTPAHFIEFFKEYEDTEGETLLELMEGILPDNWYQEILDEK